MTAVIYIALCSLFALGTAILAALFREYHYAGALAVVALATWIASLITLFGEV